MAGVANFYICPQLRAEVAKIGPRLRAGKANLYICPWLRGEVANLYLLGPFFDLRIKIEAR